MSTNVKKGPQLAQKPNRPQKVYSIKVKGNFRGMEQNYKVWASRFNSLDAQQEFLSKKSTKKKAA